MGERILVLGGIRSGKSAVAEDLVSHAGSVTYVATGAAGDAEMAARIAAHRARRPAHWTTVETTDVHAAITAAPPDAAVLVDNLAGWLAARIDAHALWPNLSPDAGGTDALAPAALHPVLTEADALWSAAAARPGGRVVVVADESGLGLVPADATARRWLDVAGAVTQQLAAHADRVLLVVAGHVLALGADSLAHPAAPPRLHGDTMVPDGALDFAVSVHGDGPPAHVRAVLDKALDEAHRYPDERPACAAVAARHQRDPAEVLLTAGAADAFWLLARVVRARTAAVVHPAFTEPEAALRAAGLPVTHVLRSPEQGWSLDPGAVPDDADLVVVGNPNNPTGTLDDPGRVAALCRPGRVTIVDEAFIDFVPDADTASLARHRLPGLVVVRSITKLWGLAGVRAGYVLAAPGLVARCAAVRAPWAVSALALAALQTCAQDEAYRRDVAVQVAGARAALLRRLRRLDGVEAWDSAANFVLLRVPDGPRVHAALLARGIAVRPSTFPGLDERHLRVAVRDARANDRLVAALELTI